MTKKILKEKLITILDDNIDILNKKDLFDICDKIKEMQKQKQD